MRRDHRGRASARRRRSEPCSVHNWGSQANSGGRAPCTVSRYVESMVLNVSISSHNGIHTQHSMRNLAAFICPDRAGADQCRNLNPTLAPILIILQAVGTVVVGFSRTSDGHNHRQGATFARADSYHSRASRELAWPGQASLLGPTLVGLGRSVANRGRCSQVAVLQIFS